MEQIGELAALTTACMWALTSVFFSEAGKLIGSFFVNKIRLVLAVLLYATALFLTAGYIFPPSINREQYLWLGLSGIVGLVVGDSCGFKALVMIGPRLTTLMWSSAPIMATIIAWIFLGEKLGALDIVGIIVTLSGISWVVAERKSQPRKHAVTGDHPDSGTYTKGILYGLGAAAGQASGLVMAKQGMFNAGGSVDPFEASMIRMAISMVVIWIISGLRGQVPSAVRKFKNRRAMAFCLAGALVGPFFGVWMSLYALKFIPAGIAATLNSMTPVIVIPILIYYYKEKVSLRAVAGAVIAVGGVALLFLS